MRLVASLLISLLAAGGAAAAPVPPPLQAELLDVFHRYGEALKAGQLSAALALRDAKTRAGGTREARTPAARREFLQMAAATVPDSVEVVHGRVSGAGQSATLIAEAFKRLPPGQTDPDAPDGVMHGGLTLSYVREGGVWKLSDILFGPSTRAAMACTDERSEPASAYDADSESSVGGPITRVVFAPDHTLVVVSVVGEPACLFLPPRAQLAGMGVSPEALVPYAEISADGHEHLTDKHKVRVDHATVTPEGG